MVEDYTEFLSPSRLKIAEAEDKQALFEKSDSSGPKTFGVNCSLEIPFLFTTNWGNWNDQLTPLASAKLHRPLWVPVMLRVSFIQPFFFRLSWQAAGQWRESLKFEGFPEVCNWEENALGVMKYSDNILMHPTRKSAQTSQQIEQKQQNGWWNLGFSCGYT